jgi:endoglucanase
MTNEACDLLKKLVATPTPTGFEYDGMKVLADALKQAGVKDMEIDIHGNLRACLNREAPLRVMIEGHCDEIGFIVQHIDDDGFLYVSALGGVTVPTVLSERIIIQGKNGPVNGVFGGRPIHLMSPKERENCAPKELTDIFVDIGATNREDALKRVSLGDCAVVDSGWRPLGNDRVACRGFDNRVGAFIVTEVMKRLVNQKLNVALHMVASVQEEVGLIGGYTSAYDINPQIGLCVDVTFASDAQKEDKKSVGDIRLGKGPVVGCGPTYHKGVRELIIGEAEKMKMETQIQVRSRGTGTCAFAMRMTRSGAAVAQFSIPLRYMHSPIETLSLSDVEKTIDLMAATILAIPADMNLCPVQP